MTSGDVPLVFSSRGLTEKSPLNLLGYKVGLLKLDTSNMFYCVIEL